MKKTFIYIIFLLFSSNFAFAKNNCDIIIKDRKFQSGNLKKTSDKKEECAFKIKSGERMALKICNKDDLVAEFESHNLAIEKIIPANSTALIRIRPIKKGEIFEFEEEFSEYECKFVGI